jgi:hypothetical protein
MLLLFYLFFGSAYQFTLYYTSGMQGYDGIIARGTLDYVLKGLLTIPIWWLVFRRLEHWSLPAKVGLHFLLLPVFIFVWINVYYYLCDQLGLGHLGKWGKGWDVYIPGLFYIMQFGIFHLYHHHEQLKRQLKKEAELRELALSSEMSALKAQLNPHFLYNTFNTISASLPPEQEATRELIAKLADMFRYILKASRTDEVFLKEELNFVEKYLDLEKARFGERLGIRIEVTEDLLHKKVPPMILQPLVENAVKHGISPKMEGGIIKITAREEEQVLHLSVQDTGVGLGSGRSDGGGVGLENTRLRLAKMYNTLLQTMAPAEGGFSVRFEIPQS